MNTTHDSYRARALALQADDDVGFDPFAQDPETRDWLFAVFCDNGALTPAYLAPLVLARRQRLTRSALAETA
ncbi:hypothetical protein ABZ858_14235 [Streptomyces sp. NPDC047017]|uniref:hypothetical protein n=1 Tax=Streptomyces sp. NPDC047017 TaxID=3155024 RepID=UPI0033D743EE